MVVAVHNPARTALSPAWRKSYEPFQDHFRAPELGSYHFKNIQT